MQYDTGGNPIIFYNQCAHCNLDTGGRHQSWCPLYQQQMAEGYKQMAEVNSQLAEEGLSQFNEVGRSKMDKENSRLLTEEEYQKLPKHASTTGIISSESLPGSSDWKVYAGDIAKAQDAKTRQKIMEWLEANNIAYKVGLTIASDKWRAFKEEIK